MELTSNSVPLPPIYEVFLVNQNVLTLLVNSDQLKPGFLNQLIHAFPWAQQLVNKWACDYVDPRRDQGGSSSPSASGCDVHCGSEKWLVAVAAEFQAI